MHRQKKCLFFDFFSMRFFSKKRKISKSFFDENFSKNPCLNSNIFTAGACPGLSKLMQTHVGSCQGALTLVYLINGSPFCAQALKGNL